MACSFLGKRGSPKTVDVLPSIHVVMADVKQWWFGSNDVIDVLLAS